MRNAHNSITQYRYKPKILIALLICLSALIMMKIATVDVYATESTYRDNTKSYSDNSGVTEDGYDGTDAGKGAKVGGLYWGGSTSRTGFILYIFDTKEERVLTMSDILGYGGGARAGILVIPGENDFSRLTMDVYESHLGGITIAKRLYEKEMPAPVLWHEDTSQWSGQNDEIRKWLFEEVEGIERWVKLVTFGFSEYIAKQLTYSSGVVLCIEPVSIQACYSTQTWGEEGKDFQAQLEADVATNAYNPDKDYLDYIYGKGGDITELYKPIFNSNGNIVRVLTTGMATADVNYNQCLRYFGTADEDGGANWKWTNQAMPYCMTLEFNPELPGLDIAGINEEYPVRKSYSIH